MSGQCTNEARCLIMKNIAWSIQILSRSGPKIEGSVPGLHLGSLSCFYTGLGFRGVIVFRSCVRLQPEPR